MLIKGFTYAGVEYSEVGDKYYCNDNEIIHDIYAYLYNHYLYDHRNDIDQEEIFYSNPWNWLGVKSSLLRIIQSKLADNDVLKGYAVKHNPSGKYGSHNHMTDDSKEMIIYRDKEAAYRDRFYRTDTYYVVKVVVTKKSMKEVR